MLRLPSVWLVCPPPSGWLSPSDSDTNIDGDDSDNGDCDDDFEMETRQQRAARLTNFPSVPEDGPPVENATQSLTDDNLGRNAARKPKRSKLNRAATTDASSLGNSHHLPSMSALSRNSSRSHQYSNVAVKGHIKIFLADKIHRDYPVVDFVKAVWGFSAGDLRKPRTYDDYVLDANACRKYTKQVYDKKKKLKNPGERPAYGPLLSIFRDLEKQVKAAYNIKNSHRGQSIVNMKDREVHGKFAGLKPDIIWGWVDEKDRQHWDTSALVGELKKGRITEAESKTFPLLKIPLNAFPSLEYGDRTDEPSTSTGKRKASAVSTTTTRRSKRLRSDVQVEEESNVADNAAPTPSMTRVPVPLTPKEIQIAKYVNELGSHGVRSYATGVLIEDCDMTLWYMDRMGAVKSISFNFLKEPHFLLLFVAAITTAPLTKLGFFPMLRFPGTFHNDYEDATLELPPVLDINGITQSDLQFDVDITDTRDIINTYGAVGRATVVVPVKSRSVAAETCCGSGNLMVKIAWQSHESEGEDAYIRAIRNAIAADPSAKKYLKHIIDMKCSITQTMREMDLPRAFMHDLREYHERVCRTLVLVEYIPLNLINSPEEFKVVFVGALRGHHAAYVSASILHRDISTNNIMFYRDSDDNAVGVMCDWDLGMRSESLSLEDMVADIVNSQIHPGQTNSAAAESESATASKRILSGQSQSQTANQSTDPHASGAIAQSEHDSPNQMPKYRTGTGPFMALDLLLYLQVPHHQYRHDLESFFWVLTWFVACFNPETHELGNIESWLQNDLRDIGKEKAELLSDRPTYDKVMSTAHSSYKDIAQSVTRLRRSLMMPVYKQYLDFKMVQWDTLKSVQESDNPLQSEIDDAMDDIKELVKTREGVLTYESFMKCLQEQP